MGLVLCQGCGKFISRDLKTSIVTFANRFYYRKMLYKRSNRFKRLLKHLEGNSTIPYEVIEFVSNSVNDRRNCQEIIKILKASVFWRKFCCKLPSIFKQLGGTIEIFTESEFRKACDMFNFLDRFNIKFSYTFLIPYCVYWIGRYNHFHKFMKTPSELLNKKYGADLRVVLRNSRYERLLPLVGFL